MAAEEKKEKSKDHAPEKDAKDKKVEKTAVAAPEDEAKSAKKKRLIIMIAGGVLVVAGGAVAAIMLLGGGGSKEAGDGHGAPAEHGAAAAKGEGAKTEAGGHGDKAAEKGKGEHAKPEGGHGESAKKEEHGAKEGQAKKDEKGKASESKDAGKSSGELEGVDFGQTQPLKPFHLNLGNPLENRYVRLEVSFEYKGGEAQKAEIEKRIPQLRDAIGNIASRKSREFLLGPDGKDQLRHEILIRVNQFMNRPIESVFITDMLIE